MRRFLDDPLRRAWAWLLALGLATTIGALAIEAGRLTPLVGAVILMIAFLKARLILARYLGLAQAPFWRRGFDLALGAFTALLLGLYLIPAA